MFNSFVLKKFMAMIFPSMLTVIAFFIGVTFFNLMVGIAVMFVGLISGLIIGTILLRNPFTDMLEGKGIMVFDMNSTGIITPFLVKVTPPYIRGRLRKDKVDDVFDRDSVMQMAAPIVNKHAARFEIPQQPREGILGQPLPGVGPIQQEQSGNGVSNSSGEIILRLDRELYNAARFGLFHWPVIIYNDQMKTVVTKDWFSDREQEAFAKHGILYLNRKTEELTSMVRDFGRYIVESLKPKEGGFFRNKWVIILLIIFVGIIIIMLGPTIFEGLKGFTGTATQSFGGLPENTVTPMG